VGAPHLRTRRAGLLNQGVPRYVNVGFWRGAALDNQAGVVRTSDQKMGHVRIASPTDIIPDMVTDLVRQAAALNARARGFLAASAPDIAITVDRIDIDGDHVRATRTCDSCIAAG
jgi:hypothetical protein